MSPGQRHCRRQAAQLRWRWQAGWAAPSARKGAAALGGRQRPAPCPPTASCFHPPPPLLHLPTSLTRAPPPPSGPHLPFPPLPLPSSPLPPSPSTPLVVRHDLPAHPLLLALHRRHGHQRGGAAGGGPRRVQAAAVARRHTPRRGWVPQGGVAVVVVGRVPRGGVAVVVGRVPWAGCCLQGWLAAGWWWQMGGGARVALAAGRWQACGCAAAGRQPRGRGRLRAACVAGWLPLPCCRGLTATAGRCACRREARGGAPQQARSGQRQRGRPHQGAWLLRQLLRLRVAGGAVLQHMRRGAVRVRGWTPALAEADGAELRGGRLAPCAACSWYGADASRWHACCSGMR